MTSLVATDLDGTVLFSERAMAAGGVRPAAADLLDIDVVDGRTYAFMTTGAARRWERLAAAGVLVPATTRSVEQYARLRLPGPPARFAVVCNGARLLVDGESDPGWERAVRRGLDAAAAPLAAVLAQAQEWHAGWNFHAVRAVEDFFVYLTAHRREAWLDTFAEQADDWARARGWRVSLQARKLYLLPAGLDKAPAVAHVADRLGAHRLLAGGDSLLDAEMLRSADEAIRPAHGELHRTGFAAPHCRTTAAAGAPAGDEILSWYAEGVGAEPPQPRVPRQWNTTELIQGGR